MNRYWEEVCKKGKAKGEEVKPSLRGAERLPRARAVLRDMKRRELDWRIGCVVYQIYVDRFAPCADFEAKKSLYPEAGEQ